MLRRVMWVYLPLGVGSGKEWRCVERRALTGYVGLSAAWSGGLVRSSGRGAPSFDGLCGFICRLEWEPGKE